MKIKTKQKINSNSNRYVLFGKTNEGLKGVPLIERNIPIPSKSTYQCRK